MKKSLLYWFSMLLILAVATSCNILKKSNTQKDKTETKLTETVEKSSFRTGDTLNYKIPNVTYKDTVIWVKNFAKENSNTIKVIYDKEGNKEVICISEEIKETEKRILDFIEKKDLKIKETEKTKTFQFKDVYFIYLFAGFFLYKFLQKRNIL